MALTKEQKNKAFDLALKITTAYGNCGDPKVNPSVMLRTLYNEIKEITEDVFKEDG